MPPTRAEIAEHVATAFEHGRVMRAELVAVAARSGAREEVLRVLERLPKGPFHDIRQLWPSLPGVPVEPAPDVSNDVA